MTLMTGPHQPSLSAGARRRATLLGVALVATSASQLRFFSAVGPGEILFAGWVGAELLHLRLRSLRVPRVITCTWLASAAGALLATVLHPGTVPVGAVLRFLANLGLIGASFSLVCALPSPAPYLRRAAMVGASGFVAVNSFFYLVAQRRPTIGPLTLYSSNRFIGWGKDPNLVGFYALGLAALLAIVLEGRRDRRRLALLLPPMIAFGLACRSDGFKLAVLASVATFIVLRIVTDRRRRVLWRLAVLLMVLSGVVVFTPRLAALARATVHETVVDQNQAAVRVDLWGQCLKVVRDAPIVGEGPIGHATVPGGRITECHNTYLEVTATSGLAAGVFFVAALGSAVHAMYRRRNLPAVSVLVGISVAMVFFMYLRHPLFWVLLAVAISAARPAGRSNPPPEQVQASPVGSPRSVSGRRGGRADRVLVIGERNG